MKSYIDSEWELLISEIQLIENSTIKEYIDYIQKEPLEGIELLRNRFEDQTEYRIYIIHLRSYILLCHAAIENFIEELAKKALQTSIKQYQDNKKVNAILLNCISNSFKNEKFELIMDSFFDRLKEHLSVIVEKNHGIKSSNISKIYNYVGINNNIYPTFDTLGDVRGKFAHYNIKEAQMKAEVYKKHSPQTYKEFIESALNDLKNNLITNLIISSEIYLQ